MNPFRQHDSGPETAAAQWLARRDRGLSAAEQDAYLQWLHESPEHGREIARQAKAWQRLDSLRDWLPAHSSHPNPNLLAPPRRRKWVWGTLAAAAAAAVVVAALSWRPAGDAGDSRHRTIVHPGPRRLTLADGSLVELNADARIRADFTPGQRTVHLLSGEAHFIVAKNPARPFVVEAGKFTVRAVGTAFDVNLGGEAISVLVTEGNVQLGEQQPAGEPSLLRRLSAGQQATVEPRGAASPSPAVLVHDLSPAEIDAALAWQSLRLEFVDLPLREVVAEFNRFNSRKLVVADARTGDILVGGTFRADNVEAFVRLLDVGFGVRAMPRGEDLVLVHRE
ncbi:MAG TPA: FecR domain-containing protein [Opitutus sp.]|nr:FecR domain-containing protein [Opitutus sp.]